VNSPSTQYYYQLTLRERLRNERLSLTLNINNFHLRYLDYQTVSEDPSFRAVTVSSNPFRVIYLGATCSFGKLKEPVSKKRGIVNEDVGPGMGTRAYATLIAT
jgi:hypothetical protein